MDDIDLEKLWEAVDCLNGWMVTNGPLSVSAEMGLKDLIAGMEEDIEETSQEIEEFKESHAEEIERYRERLDKETPEKLMVKLSGAREDARKFRKEVAEQEKELETANAKIEGLEAALRAERERREIESKKLKQKINELEQDALSQAW